jgi:hypothetical protein
MLKPSSGFIWTLKTMKIPIEKWTNFKQQITSLTGSQQLVHEYIRVLYWIWTRL